jgi:hypothetical protein
VGPLANDLGEPGRAGGPAEHAELAVADLVAVTVGAVQDVAGPAVGQPWDVGQFVAESGGDQQPPRRDPLAVAEEHPEAAAAVGHQVRDGVDDDVTAVPLDFIPARGEELGGRKSVASEIAMHVCGRGVARLTGIDDEDLAPGARENQGRGQAGGAATDDHHVVSVHVPRLAASGLFTYERCCFREMGVR